MFQSLASEVLTSAKTIWVAIASVVLAICTPWVLRHIYRPKVVLDAGTDLPFCHWISPRFPLPKDNGEPAQHARASEEHKQIEIYFARVIIGNDGRVEAERVEVTIRQVYRDAEGGWEPIGRFVPLNLRWSNTWDIAKTGEDAPGESKILTKERISERGERLCDLGFIVEPSLYGEFCRRTRLRDRPRNPAPTHDAEARFHFAFEYIRDEERGRLMPGRYLLEIVADALRIRPRTFWPDLEIPAAIPIPKSDEEREKGLRGFHLHCYRKRPAARFTSPSDSAAMPRLPLLLRHFRVPFRRA